MEAVENDEVSMIGLYGMGGCGKTTLAMEIMNTKKHLFDKMLFVPVSSSLDVRRIQDKIASSLQFQFPESEEMERAQRLRTRLIQENKILLVLDDVWEILDFDTIGIPTSTTHKGCKVLITTRLEAVCTSMDCQRRISLSILENDEAWALFQKQACLSEVTSETLKHLARLISNECKGLPVAIAAVAGTLKGKSEVEWKVALDRLLNSKPVNVEKGLQNPYKCLQLSYDNLDTEEAKSLFLLCSVYPEDYEIYVGQLTISAIGLGLSGEIHSYEGARNEISATKNKLISSSLLLAVGGEHVKMHDLVRDVAHWIAKEQYRNMNGQYSPRYLWIENIPYELDFSNLEYLRICTEFEISSEFFKRMGKLRVLLLSNRAERRTLSSMSFKSLTNLRSLSLNLWEVSDFSFLGDMKELECLDLYCCSFIELPNDVAVTQLKNLRLLSLQKCYIEKNNFEVIARLQLLEELYIVAWPAWNHYSENIAELFNKFSVVQRLKRYMINGGLLECPYFDFDEGVPPYQKFLELGYYHTSYAAAKVLAQRAEWLVLSHIEGCAKNLMPDIIQIGGGSMNELKAVKISDSKEIEYLIDTSNHLSEVGNLLVLFPELLSLKFFNMDHLIALSRGHLPSNGPFQKLQELHLFDCPELTYLFTTGVARSLVELKYLSIFECHGLKHILVDDDTEGISPDDNSLVFSKLKDLTVHNCEKIEYIIPVTFALGLQKLEKLDISENDALKYVFGRNTHGHGDQSGIELPALGFLYLDALPQTISIFPDNCYPRFPSFHKFCLINCPEFATKSIRTCRKIERHDHEETKDLELENLPQLMYTYMFFKDTYKFEKLEILKITGCKKVDIIFHAKFLNELKILVIKECKELKQIVDEDVENDKSSNLLSQQPQKPCFPKLELLFVEECHKLKRFISFSRCNDLPNLVVLIVNKCSELEELIGCEQGNDYKIGEKNVQLPKLKYLMFRKLSKLCQGIESQTIRHHVVDNCPKLSLTSTATFDDFELQVLNDNENAIECWDELREIFSMIKDENSSEEAQAASGSVSPSSQKLVDQEQTSEPGVLEEQVSLGGTISIEDIGKERTQEGGTSKETRMKTLSAGVEGVGEGSHLMNKEGRIGVISNDSIEVPPGVYTNFVDMVDAQIATNNVQLKSCPDIETDLDKESADNLINIEDLCVSQLAADNLVSNAVVDLEESLKMPLKDIARSEANRIRLLTALKFLSHLSLEDAALSDGLKAIIDSMHKEFPSILCSFKQAFVTSVKFAVIRAHQNEAASNLVSKISKAKEFLDEAQQKEEILIKEIIWLKKEMKDHEADLSSLQEEKMKCIQETIGYKREFENLRKDMSQTVEDQRIARQELFEVEYKWSTLCSQFQNNRIVDRNHF